MRVYHRCFLTLACVCGGGLEVGFVSSCSWSALVTSVGGYVLVGVEIGILSCIFLYFCGFQGGGCVCACIRAYTQVWDGHLESQMNPDRQKCSIHVDRIGVPSTFVYMYAVLRGFDDLG